MTGECVIRFAAEYCKMPFSAEDMMDPDRPTVLLAVLRVGREQLSEELIEWDTKFRWQEGSFVVSDINREFLVLLLLTGGHLWTTIRTPEKEAQYRSFVGKEVIIQI